MIRLNPDISVIFDEKASPRPMKVAATRTMNTRDSRNPARLGIFIPMIIPATSMIKACRTPVVKPPAVRPRTMAILLTGATIISFRKPNSLSQMTERPAKVAENSNVMPIIPGVRKLT